MTKPNLPQVNLPDGWHKIPGDAVGDGKRPSFWISEHTWADHNNQPVIRYDCFVYVVGGEIKSLDIAPPNDLRAYFRIAWAEQLWGVKMADLFPTFDEWADELKVEV